ncbi:MAG TPA: hypothetical protein VFS43_45135 [Polyangiaceae bacterium]|nr:hypothetical protein [Polyangiaceae bacterium]
MTDAEIAAELAALGLERRWVDLGVLTDEWLHPAGRRRSKIAHDAKFFAELGIAPQGCSPLEMLRQALYEYLMDRERLDDATLAEVLDAAAGADNCSSMLADWKRLTAAQLAQVARHAASPPDARRLAAQKLRVYELETGQDVALSLVGFDDGEPDEHHDAARVFEVRGFRFAVAWEQRLSARDRRRIGELLAALPADSQARCHMPAFGLRLDPGTRDEARMSICFTCNNAYLDGGGTRTFGGQSRPGREFLAYLMKLAPSAWRAHVAQRSEM